MKLGKKEVSGKPRGIVRRFLSKLCEKLGSKEPLAIAMSEAEALELDVSHARAEGIRWKENLSQERNFDFIVADLPLGLTKRKMNIGGVEISARRNWIELLNALHLLAENGMCLALVEPPAFSTVEGRKFEQAINKEGYFVHGIFNPPENLLETTTLRPALVAIRRAESKDVFVGELEDEEQASRLAQNFVSKKSGHSLFEGILLRPGVFKGFANLKIEQQIARLQTQYKEYQSVRLGDVCEEINAVRSGETHKPRENAVYIPMIGICLVTHDIDQVTVKHQNLFQVVLSKRVNNEYLSAYLRSDLGRLSLSLSKRATFIPKISKSNLEDMKVALPGIHEQKEIALTHRELSSLSENIADFQKDLALNPKNISDVRSHIERMLDVIGELSESDKVLSLVRSGESKTVEFKQTLSFDTKKGIKEKYIEEAVLKTIVAFLNTDGGTLLIGVSDSGEIISVDAEIFKFYKVKDKFLLHLKNLIKQRIGEQYYPFIDHRLVRVSGHEVLVVECKASTNPCYLDGKDFFVRTNPATDKLEGPKMLEYVKNHFNA